MIELKEATLTIDGHELFRNLSLMAQDGQMTCITGPAGSGKTAVVMVMLGFLPLDEGLVSMDGELITPLSVPVFRKLMAYVPQRRSVTVSQPEADTSGLETIWSPYNSRRAVLTAIDEHLDVAPLASKPVIIVDDPAPDLLAMLKSLADGGHTVVVCSEREEYLSQSDKTIILETHDVIKS